MLSKRQDLSKRTTYLFITLIFMVILAIGLYIFSRTFFNSWQVGTSLPPAVFWSITSRTMPAIIGIILASLVIACVTLNFQTITGSRILTPAMLGFDAIFVGTQVLIVLILGSTHAVFVNENVNFFITAGVMVLISVTMFGAILRNKSNNLVFLLLFGMIISGIIRNLTVWVMQVMEANDFSHIQSATQVTINNMNTGIIPVIAPFMVGIVVVLMLRNKTYDAISLGESNAKNLGVSYNKEFQISLFLIAIGMALATALIGSITFLGLLVVNISKELFKTYRHKTLFMASSLMAMFALIFGQAIIEMLGNIMPVTVIIDLVGCSYMFYLIIKENKKV